MSTCMPVRQVQKSSRLSRRLAGTLHETGRVWPFTSRQMMVWVGGFCDSGAWAEAAPAAATNAAAAIRVVRIIGLTSSST